LNPFNPETTVLSSAQGVFLEKEGHRSAYGLEASTPHKRQFLVKLRDVNAIDAAEQCVGAILYVDEAALHSLKAGEYYHYEAVGIEVFDLKGDCVGVITRIWSPGGDNIYVVQVQSMEYLITALKDTMEKKVFTTGTV